MKTTLLSLLLAATVHGAVKFVPNTIYDHAEPVDLPELLATSDGRPVKTVESWERVRRPEILSFLARNVYGVRPVERPDDLAFTPVGPDEKLLDGKVIRRRTKISFSGPRGTWSFTAHAYLPPTASAEKSVPTFVILCNFYTEAHVDFDLKTESSRIPFARIIARGYAVVAFMASEIAQDLGYGPTFAADGSAVIRDPPFTNGLFACWAPARTQESWGAISAWAWGFSRVMDWIETQPDFDRRRVAAIGHSRDGKTALWAGATDRRFALICSNDSGCCGAKMNHVAVSLSETIQQDNNNNPHWFCRAFRKFNGRDAYLPYDQHWLAALIAPRLLYIASGSDDWGAGPWGEFLTARHASPVWTLYGRRGLVEDHAYAIERPFQEGCVGYHLREGGHGLKPYDWERYMDYADRHLRP